MNEIKDIAKHGEVVPKSIKVKVKFKDKKRDKAIERAKGFHSVKH